MFASRMDSLVAASSAVSYQHRSLPPLAPHTLVSSTALARRRHPRVQAQQGNDPEGRPEGAQPANALASLRQAVATPAYRYWLPAGVALGILMLLDAAYSGDWSRIGAITPEQEQQLQGVVPVALGGHAACAAAAGVVSARRGEAWAPRAAKTLAGGFATLLEVLVLPNS